MRERRRSAISVPTAPVVLDMSSACSEVILIPSAALAPLWADTFCHPCTNTTYARIRTAITQMLAFTLVASDDL